MPEFHPDPDCRENRTAYVTTRNRGIAQSEVSMAVHRLCMPSSLVRAVRSVCLDAAGAAVGTGFHMWTRKTRKSPVRRVGSLHRKKGCAVCTATWSHLPWESLSRAPRAANDDWNSGGEVFFAPSNITSLLGQYSHEAFSFIGKIGRAGLLLPSIDSLQSQLSFGVKSLAAGLFFFPAKRCVTAIIYARVVVLGMH